MILILIPTSTNALLKMDVFDFGAALFTITKEPDPAPVPNSKATKAQITEALAEARQAAHNAAEQRTIALWIAGIVILFQLLR